MAHLCFDGCTHEDHDEQAVALWQKAMLCSVGFGLGGLLLGALGWEHMGVFVGAAGMAIQLGAYLFFLMRL